MGSMSIVHWLIVLAVVLLLFGGRGRFSNLMGDVGKGMKEFKKSIADEDAAPPPQIAPPPPLPPVDAPPPSGTTGTPVVDSRPLPPTDTVR